MVIGMKMGLNSKFVRFAALWIACSGICFTALADKIGNDLITISVQKELDRQLGVSAGGVSQDVGDGLRKKISSSVNKEIHNQLFFALRDDAKKRIYDSDAAKGAQHTPIDFVYKVPTWPTPALFFLKKDVIIVEVKASWATQEHGSSGSTKDISHLLFQEEPFYVKNILLASNLIDQELATPTSKYKFLELLKDQLLSFDASIDRQELAFSYVRHFLRGDVALGLTVPVVRQNNEIKLSTELTPQQNDLLASQNPDFATLYPNGLIDFFKDILLRKNIGFNECDTEVGIGDISTFFYYEIPTRHCEKAIVGIKALFPTSKRRDVYKLWDPELGNGGFTELSLFGSLLFSYSKWFNPHLFAQATYSVPSRVFRRVPRKRETDDVVASVTKRYGDDFTPYGNYIQYSGSSVPTFSELDATVKRFSDTTRKTKISRGGEIFLRVGNMFTNVFHERTFFDLFYDLIAKGKDYLGFIKPDCEYDPSILTNNTFEVGHRLGAAFSWQLDDTWRLRFGGFYEFAGRNRVREFGLEGVLSLEF